MSLPVFVSGTPPTIDHVIAQLQPFVAREADLTRRMRVAKGLLPAPPEALVPAMLWLFSDPEAQVKAAVRESLGTMPADLLGPVLRGLKEPAMLDVAARLLYKTDAFSREILLNHATADDTLRWLAGVGSKEVCDIISQNQVRALRHPAIIEALYLNPRAAQGPTQGLLELAVRQNLSLDHIVGFRETKALLLGEERGADTEQGLSDAEFAVAMLVAIGQGEQVAAAVKPGEEERKTNNIQVLIMKMSVAQKVRLASVGDGQVRKLLIRDPKKMVAYAVLKSPRLTDGEITGFAANKALAEDILSQICRNRQWTKDYSVRRALVMNPKTPLPFSMTFLRTLNGKDLKDVASSRDVNQNVARAAKRILASGQA